MQIKNKKDLHSRITNAIHKFENCELTTTAYNARSNYKKYKKVWTERYGKLPMEFRNKCTASVGDRNIVDPVQYKPRAKYVPPIGKHFAIIRTTDGILVSSFYPTHDEAMKARRRIVRYIKSKASQPELTEMELELRAMSRRHHKYK